MKGFNNDRDMTGVIVIYDPGHYFCVGNRCIMNAS